VPVHASPVEHIATPVSFKMMLDLCDSGIEIEGMTHVAVNGQPWSGNLRGWIQYRQLIDNNVREG
jgi:hypothetical protein